jgi:hypothetical protein
MGALIQEGLTLLCVEVIDLKGRIVEDDILKNGGV